MKKHTILNSKQLIERLHTDNEAAKQNRLNIEVCKRFLIHFADKQKTINKRVDSYQLKRILEEIHKFLGVPCYVVAKQLRIAARELGFKVSRQKCFNANYSRLKQFLIKNNLKGKI